MAAGVQPSGVIRASRRRWPAAAVAAIAVVGVAVTMGAVDAAFQGIAANTGNVVSATSTFPRYAQAVQDDHPSFTYRLGEQPAAGSAANASATTAPAGRYETPYAFRVPGATGVGDQALDVLAYTETTSGLSSPLVTDPQAFTAEAWFRTTATHGGKIIGFGDSASGSSRNYDRHVYMTDDGRLEFGVYPGQFQIVTSTATYNDGSWHLVDASVGAAGLELFVDGMLVASDASVTSAQHYDGYWRVGGDSLGGWPDAPSWDHIDATVDEVAVYPAQLDPTAVTAHHDAAIGTGYTAAVLADHPDLYWRLDDAAGAGVADSSGNGRAGTLTDGAAWAGLTSVAGATGGGAARFDGQGTLSSSRDVVGPTAFSEELWFSTTSSSGGKLIGLGNRQRGWSSTYDRHVYLTDDGHLVFGVNPPSAPITTITTPSTYRDGSWHHVVATSGTHGIHLYVDGVDEVGNTGVSGGESFTGFWRVGGDNLGNWPGVHSDYMTADIDDVAVYPAELTPATVAAHYAARNGDYQAAVRADDPDLYWRLDDGANLATGAADSGSHADPGIAMSLWIPYAVTDGPMRAGQPATTAVHFADADGVWTTVKQRAPQVFTVECWFRTTTTVGGGVVGFASDNRWGATYYDRMVYLRDDGHLVFGVYSGSTEETLATVRAYNDGGWHHLAASLGAAGMRFYVDGHLEGADTSTTTAADYDGYWRIGNQPSWGWPGSDSQALVGDLAEVAVYPTQLSDDRVRVHAYANH